MNDDVIYPIPTVRVSLHVDHFPINPLENWDHGIQFVTINSSRDYKDMDEYSNTYDGVALLDFDPREFAEIGGSHEDTQWCFTCMGTGEQFPAVKCETCGGTGSIPFGRRRPSLRVYLDRVCAGWGILNRNGYDGTLSLYTSPRDKEPDDIAGAEAIALVSRDMFRAWNMIPDGKPMPRGYRRLTEEAIEVVIAEYNAWAIGDVYGIEVEVHNPACPYCEDVANPDHDCKCWDVDPYADTTYGLIGYEYAMEELHNVASRYTEQEVAS